MTIASVLPALTFGFLLGVRHATDADHIAAIGTMLAPGSGRSTGRAALIGGAWGIGHSVSILIVGGALIMLRLPMPPRLALGLEFVAAVMLIGLGARSLIVRAREDGVSAIRPLSVGMIHGLAGSAVLAFLVLGATHTATEAALYLVCFCIGTIAGMALITLFLAFPLRALRMPSFERSLRVAAGVASVAIGLALAHRVSVRDGLFAATPTWTAE